MGTNKNTKKEGGKRRQHSRVGQFGESKGKLWRMKKDVFE
jgi:hypothetical protein